MPHQSRPVQDQLQILDGHLRQLERRGSLLVAIGLGADGHLLVREESPGEETTVLHRDEADLGGIFPEGLRSPVRGWAFEISGRELHVSWLYSVPAFHLYP